MKQHKLVLLVGILAFSMVVSGCFKKSSEQANATGFETLSTTEELAQLPQSSTTSSSSQQTGIETLPVETSPVTQSIAQDAGHELSQTISTVTQSTAAATQAVSSSRNIQIQTALKNAGFYSGSLDGKIGPASKRAIEAFQKSNNLKADGKVGPKTWAAMEKYLSGAASAAVETTSIQ